MENFEQNEQIGGTVRMTRVLIQTSPQVWQDIYHTTSMSRANALCDYVVEETPGMTFRLYTEDIPCVGCSMWDDGDVENGPHLAVEFDQNCGVHGRLADPEGWACLSKIHAANTAPMISASDMSRLWFFISGDDQTDGCPCCQNDPGADDPSVTIQHGMPKADDGEYADCTCGYRSAAPGTMDGCQCPPLEEETPENLAVLEARKQESLDNFYGPLTDSAIQAINGATGGNVARMGEAWTREMLQPLWSWGQRYFDGEEVGAGPDDLIAMVVDMVCAMQGEPSPDLPRGGSGSHPQYRGSEIDLANPAFSETEPPICSYCDAHVGDNEWDAESHGYFGSHSRCVQPSAKGRWGLLLDGHVHVRFTTRKRAESELLHLVRANPGIEAGIIDFGAEHVEVARETAAEIAAAWRAGDGTLIDGVHPWAALATLHVEAWELELAPPKQN